MPPDADPAVLVERCRRNLGEVRARIAAACGRSGRSPDEVVLLAITKYASLEEVRALVSAGQRDLGENRAREGEVRRKAVEGDVRWHMVGHLQTNKARRAVGWADVLHSLDRPSLAEKLEKSLAESNRVLPSYVQVNVSAEPQKGGIPPEDVERWVGDLRKTCPHLDLRGLMTMAPYDAPESVTRPIFRRLRELRDACGLPGLSMGMSGDFEVAVEEGATIVRVGSALLRE